MTKKIRVLFEKLKKTPFPDLGKSVGDFALYDSLMAGTVSSFLGGEKIDLKTIPIPDKETQTVFKALEKKRRLDGKETDFVRYVQLWEELAEEIKNAVKVGRGKGNGTAKQESAVLGPANQ